jgi:hypothetical protein
MTNIDKDIVENALQTAQRCRRNWDLSKSIPEEHIDIFKYSVSNSPTKQNEEYYSVIFVTDRNIIEQIYTHTNFNSDLEIADLSKNPQVLANLLVVFCKREPTTFRNNLDEYSSDLIMSENRNISIGIASGQLALTAALFGYSTGFCKCFDAETIGKILEDTPLLLLGIGFPDTDRDRTEHQISGIKFNTFNKPITIKNISSNNIVEESVSGNAFSKNFTIELKFTAPKNIILTGRGKEWMKQMGLGSEYIRQLVVDIQNTGKKLNIDPGYPYFNPKENSLKYVWTSDNLKKLELFKKYILSSPSIIFIVDDLTSKGWIVE